MGRGPWGIAVVIGLFCAFATSASAFEVDYELTPSTTQAGGHPNATVSLLRLGTDDEDLRDLTLDLPPGLIGNPEATSTKCTQAQFQADACPAGSEVGSVSAVATAVIELPPVPGTIYLLEPAPDDAATLGIVLRPPVPLAIDKLFSVGHIKTYRTPDGDYGLRTLVMNLPRQITLLGLIPVDITLQQLTMTLNATASNGFFMTNPTSCQPADSTVKAVSYLDQEVSDGSSYTPTNCEAVPFDPAFDFKTDASAINARVRPTVTINVPADNDPLSQSNVSDVHARFPPGMTLDILGAFGIPTCSDAALEADACPASTDIGNAVVSVPVLPPDFTGDVYHVNPGPGDVYAFGLVLRGPRGVKATARGGSFLDTTTNEDGIVLRINADFLNLPQIPFTKFEMALTRDFFINPPTCGTRSAEATVVGHSGAVRNLSDQYTVNGCYPRPKGATPLYASLVPAYEPCAAPNRSHGPPLASPSCNPPSPASDFLTVGTADANGEPASAVGSLRFGVIAGNPATPADEADVQLAFSITDVRQAGSLSDYGGELRAVTTLRITDLANGASGDQPATVQDVPFEFDVPCVPTPGAAGSDCSLTTTADAVTLGIAQEGKRATWRVSQVQVLDGGADGDPGTPGNTVFARQGVFVP